MRLCFPVLRNAGYANVAERRRERASRKVGREGGGRGRGRKRRREERSARGTRRKKQKKRGTHPRGRPNGRAGHCTRLCECNSLQLHCERRAKTSTIVVCTGAMPYLGVTLPAALTCILAVHADTRSLFSSLLFSFFVLYLLQVLELSRKGPRWEHEVVVSGDNSLRRCSRAHLTRVSHK